MHRPASNLNLRECFRGAHVCLTEVACRPEKPERLPERAMPVHAILFQRWGLWIMHRGRQQTLIDPTRIVLFNPGEPYTASHPAGCADDCDFIGINPGIVRDALKDLGRERDADAGPVFPFDTAPIDVRLLARQRLVFRLALAVGGADPLLAEEESLALVGAVLGAPLAAAGTSPIRVGLHAARARAALAGITRAFLAENFRRHLTLNDISDAVESSPFHLCRVFKSAAGCSIHEHLTRLRLAASLRDLEVHINVHAQDREREGDELGPRQDDGVSGRDLVPGGVELDGGGAAAHPLALDCDPVEVGVCHRGVFRIDIGGPQVLAEPHGGAGQWAGLVARRLKALRVVHDGLGVGVGAQQHAQSDQRTLHGFTPLGSRRPRSPGVVHVRPAAGGPGTGPARDGRCGVGLPMTIVDFLRPRVVRAPGSPALGGSASCIRAGRRAGLD